MLSWLILIGFGLYTTYVLSGHFGLRSTPYSGAQIWKTSLSNGYLAWSMYWGIPGGLAFIRRGLNRLLCFGFSLTTLVSLLFFLTFAAVFLVFYPSLGGGIYHFLQRWRKAAAEAKMNTLAAAVAPAIHVNIPPTTNTPPLQAPSSDVEQRLQALQDLLRRGVISQAEHDQQRYNILRSV